MSILARLPLIMASAPKPESLYGELGRSVLYKQFRSRTRSKSFAPNVLWSASSAGRKRAYYRATNLQVENPRQGYFF
jgi:hypothetical protein